MSSLKLTPAIHGYQSMPGYRERSVKIVPFYEDDAREDGRKNANSRMPMKGDESSFRPRINVHDHASTISKGPAAIVSGARVEYEKGESAKTFGLSRGQRIVICRPCIFKQPTR